MPRKHPVPGEEKAICRRLRQFRLWTGRSQAEFSSLVDLNHRAYVNYEWARSQLNYEAACKILAAMPWLSPVWLAEGHEAMLQGRDFHYPAPETIGVGPRASFLQVYRMHLREGLLHAPKTHLWKPLDRLRLFTFSTDVHGRVFSRDRFGSYLLRWLAARTDSDVNDFLNELFRRAAQVVARYPRDEEAAIKRRLAEFGQIVEKRHFPSAASSPQKECKSVVDMSSGSGMLAGVSSQKALWEDLAKRLSAATCARGAKAQLARELKVTRQAVNNWLSNKRAPTGELTLRLLQWVQEAEVSQKQNPGPAPAVPGQKIQVHKSKANEKANSNPQER